MNNIMNFEGFNIEINSDETGEVLFELYSVGLALGYKITSKGITYPHKVRINKVIENAEITPIIIKDTTYLTEDMLYDFMLESKTEKCKNFRKWVTVDVLPQIRKTGGFIPAKEDETDTEILAKALVIAKRTLEEKDKNIKALEEANKTLKYELNFTNSILEGLIADITLAEKQARINQIVRKGANDRYEERYRILYEEFDRKLHINTKALFENAKKKGEIKNTTTRIEYICKYLNYTDELYEITLKLFQDSFDNLVAELKNTII